MAFDEILSGSFANYLAASRSIGADVATHAEMVNEGFKAQREFLHLASVSKAPAMSDLMKILGPTSDAIQRIQSFREKNRTSPVFNHLSAISESIPALGWVTIAPAPGPYIKEMNDAGQFYTNRVLKDWKDKDKTHVDWVKAWIQVLVELQAFVKQHHTTGLTWNVKGEDVTKGLKKVTSDMQTHKNPSLRVECGPVRTAASAGAGAGAKSAPVAVKPPRMELEGKKWLVEYQKNQPSLIIAETEMRQIVYIFKCEGSTVQVKGKVNSIVLDSCKKTSVVLDSVVSAVEFINCQSVQMQVLTKVPTISIDKTDGCQIYLNSGSLDVSIVSAKSSEMNVLVPKDGDYVEYPIPEQFKTTYNGKGLTTVISETA